MEDWYAAYTDAAQADPVVTTGEQGSTLGDEPTASAITNDDTCTGSPGGKYNCDTHVKRGGSWNYHSTTCGSTYRAQDYTWRANDHFGFRIVYNG